MLIFAIDDEPNMLYLLHEAIAEAEPDAEIMDFDLGSDAAAYLGGCGAPPLLPDVIFSDIRMPGLSGLELAVQLKQLAPGTKLVFVTGYDYAVDAYRLHVDGYITKPADAERVREELDHLFPDDKASAERIRVQCFGQFEVFWKNQPLSFSRRQTKELFAYLIDRRGALCSTDNIISVLCEGPLDTGKSKHLVWNLTSDLKTTLRSIGMEDVLVSKNRQIAIRPDLLDCDYYLALDGITHAKSTFNGEYMEQYSWAEVTKAGLHFLSKDW